MRRAPGRLRCRRRSCRSCRWWPGAGLGLGLWAHPVVLLTLRVSPQDAVLAAKARLAAHLRAGEEQNGRVREQKEAALGQLQQLKSEMSRARAKAHRSLAELTAQSGAALKALGKIVGKVRPHPNPTEPPRGKCGSQ